MLKKFFLRTIVISLAALKLINFFYKKYLKKVIAISLLINFALLMAKPVVKPSRFIEQKE